MSETNGDGTKTKTENAATNRLQGLATEGLFDNLENLKLQQDFGATVGVRKVITTIGVDKPHRQSFVRVRPGVDWRLQAAILDVDESREKYLVLPLLQDELAEDIKPVCLVVTITRHGTLSLWPLRLPAPGRTADRWAESAIEAAKIAERQWVRVQADQNAGLYETFVATAGIPEPQWPDISFNKILEMAFRGRIIDSVEHDVLMRLRGQA